MFFLLFPLLGFSQPGQGGGNPGQGGGPGGGNGNDPCLGPHPPPRCNNVPIDEDIWILLFGGSLIGGFYILRSNKLQANNKTS